MRRHTPPCPYQHLLTLLYGRIFVYIFASLTYALAYHYLLTLIKLNLWILKEHNNFNYDWKLEHHRPEYFGEITFIKFQILQRRMAHWLFGHPAIPLFLTDAISFNIALKLYILLKLISSFNFWIQFVQKCTYGDGLCELNLMLMRKNVIYDVNKVSPIYQIENKNDLSSLVGKEE